MESILAPFNLVGNATMILYNLEEIEIRFQFQRKQNNVGARIGQEEAASILFFGVEEGCEERNCQFVMARD